MDLIVRLFLRLDLLFGPRPVLRPVPVPASKHPPRAPRLPH